MNYWLIKSEPETFSWDDLKNSKNKTTSWEGVRNYQARNYLKNMKLGDLAFFYHSVAKPTAIIGIVKIVKEFYPDPLQFDSNSDYYDPKSLIESPRWVTVDVKLEKELKRPVSLHEIKNISGLEEMVLIKKGSRLSVQPVSPKEWEILIIFSKKK